MYAPEPRCQEVFEIYSRFVSAPDVVVNPGYDKKRFIIKLTEMGLADEVSTAVLSPLNASFTRSDLKRRRPK